MSYNWFKGLPEDPPPSPIVKCEPKLDYYALAKDKQRAKEHLFTYPQDLFKVLDYDNTGVNSYRFGYNWDDECLPQEVTLEEVTFFDIVITYKTLTEKDLLEISDVGSLDWFKISQKVPLSNDVLSKYQDQVDWDKISSLWMCDKDDEFLVRFHDMIRWEHVTSLHVSLNSIEEFVFVKRYIPINTAVERMVLTISLIEKYLPIIIKESGCLLVRKYSVIELESIDECLEDYLMEHKELFAMNCTMTRYVPRKYLHVIMSCRRDVIFKFLTSCEPPEVLLEPFMDNSSLLSIVSHNQYKCSDEFIDKYKHVLDVRALLRWKMLDIKDVPEEYHAIYRAKLVREQSVSPEFIDQYAEELDCFDVCRRIKHCQNHSLKNSNTA